MRMTILSLIVIIIALQSCCEEKENPGPQKITYRLAVSDMGNGMYFCYDCNTHFVKEPGIYDTSFYRQLNEPCYFNVTSSCIDSQKISFVMQILRNDVEVKSKSYTRNNICGSVDLSINYLIIP